MNVRTSTHKLSVVRTLYDRATIISDEKDRQEEEQHIKNVLTHCLYPGWAINKGRQWVQNNNKEDKKIKKKTSNAENQGMVTLPLIRSVTERIQRVVQKHHINTTVKPYTNVWQLIGKSFLFRYCLFKATLQSQAGAFQRGKLMRMKLLMTVQFVK